MLIWPALLNGRKSAVEMGARIDLELVDEHRFGNGVSISAVARAVSRVVDGADAGEARRPTEFGREVAAARGARTTEDHTDTAVMRHRQPGGWWSGSLPTAPATRNPRPDAAWPLRDT